MTSDEESKARAREYVEAVRDASLERVTPDKRAAVLGYWNSRGAMFRSLATPLRLFEKAEVDSSRSGGRLRSFVTSYIDWRKMMWHANR